MSKEPSPAKGGAEDCGTSWGGSGRARKTVKKLLAYLDRIKRAKTYFSQVGLRSLMGGRGLNCSISANERKG